MFDEQRSMALAEKVEAKNDPKPRPSGGLIRDLTDAIRWEIREISYDIGLMTRGQKITAVSLLALVGGTLAYGGFGETVSVNMVDVDETSGAPRLARTFRVDVNMTEHCVRLRERYEDAVAAVLTSAPERRTIGDLTPAQLKSIADARRLLGEVPPGEAKDIVELSPADDVSRLATETTAPQKSWWGIKYGQAK